MEPDEIKFYLILYLIYLSDCFFLPRSSALLLYSRFRGFKSRVKSTYASPVFGGRFWLLRPLFPPIGGARLLELPRCSFGLNGFCSASVLSESASGGERARFIFYDAIESVEIRDFVLWINDEKWFSGSRNIEALKCDLEFVVGSSDRDKAVRGILESSFEAGRAAGEKLAGLRRKTEGLSFFCSLYAILLLLVLPYGLFHFPVRMQIWGLGVPAVLLHALCCALYVWSHSRLLPGQTGHRWEHFFKMFLCPPMLLRACDVIEDRFDIEGDAVSVLISCSNEKIWKPEVGKLWRRLMPCSRSNLPPDAAAAIERFAGLYRLVLADELSNREVETTEFEIDAGRIPVGTMFCPRCETQFQGSMTACNDCGGVKLAAGKKD